jgi:hypothetical protein
MRPLRLILVAMLFVAVGTPVSKNSKSHLRGDFAMAQDQAIAPSNDLALEEQQRRIEKLQLEIAALRNPSPGYKTIVELVPLLTALLTVIALAAGAYKYFGDREEARRAQERVQFRADVDQILAFPTDAKISLARVTFVLHDLDDLTRDDRAARQNVTDVIERLVANDLDFDKLRDVSFDVIALDHWVDYAERTRRAEKSRDILYKYYQALRHLYEENKEYFSSIDFDKEAGGYVVQKYTEEEKFLRFAQLATGYIRRVRLTPNAVARQEAITKFADALHNPRLATRLFDAPP